MHCQSVDLNAVIDESAKLLGRLIGEHIHLELALSRPLPLVEADSGMMEQIFMNLAVNARDAMPRGGRLVMSIARSVNRRTREFATGTPLQILLSRLLAAVGLFVVVVPIGWMGRRRRLSESR